MILIGTRIAEQQAETTTRADTTELPTFLCERHREPPKGFEFVKASEIDHRVQMAFAKVVESNKWPIYLYGGQGTGKTCAAACMYMACRGGEYQAKWYSVDSVIQSVIKCRQGPGYIEAEHPITGSYRLWESKIFQRFDDARFVVMDDMGTRNLSDSGYEILKRMIDNRKGKPTLYTSNLSPSALGKIYDARLVSRVTEGTVIELTCDDRRWANNVRTKI